MLIVITDLDHDVHGLIMSAHRPSTKRTYMSAQRQYLDFCNYYSLCALPATEQTILRFLAFTQSNQRKFVCGNTVSVKPKATTLSVYLSAVNSLHVLKGFKNPPISTPRIKLILKAIDEASSGPSQKAPITYELLHGMLSFIQNIPNALMWKAALTLGFFGTLRGAEYAIQYDSTGNGALMCPPLLVSHISFGINQGVQYLHVFIPRSKTMPHGMSKVIGCSGTEVCAVCSMWQYLEFRSTTRGQLSPQDYLFRAVDGSVLDKATLNKQIKYLAGLLSLDPRNYTSHSLRSGSATSAGVRDFSDFEIKQMGGWKSNAYTMYIRNQITHHVHFAKRIAKPSLR